MAKTWHTIVALLIVVVRCTAMDQQQQRNSHQDDDKPFPQELVFCKPTTKKDERVASHSRTSSMVLISTLDGRLSAIDTHTGRLKWTMMTGPGSMLSSSISQLEISSQGRWVRLIPSLEGNLYKFDGQQLEALPVTADNLLSNSLKLADDVMITGGKDNRAYGIDFTTGKLKYICSITGCQYFGNEIVNQASLLVIRRFTNTVRAIDPLSGLEKWNYSVGQLELEFLDQPPDIVCDHRQKQGVDDDYNWMDEEAADEKDSEAAEPDMKIMTPQGTVQAVTPNKSGTLIWQQQFDSPIANAWVLRDGTLKKMNLLENVQRPQFDKDIDEEILSSASLYLGCHLQQYYIQQSPEVYRKVAAANLLFTLDGNTNFPRIQWKPYLVTAVSRTPIITSSHTSRGINLIGQPQRSHSEEVTALMVHQDSDYPYDGGYYIFPEETYLDPEFFVNNSELEQPYLTEQQVLIISLWYWWKEIFGLTILTFICNYFFTRCIWKWMRKRSVDKPDAAISESSESSKEVKTPTTTLQEPNGVLLESNGEAIKTADTFVSRYYTDFEPIQRLGKGGFGVVFQARNNIDDCEYAVKRICLPTREEAREKVKREVKALAKLDHVGIVRYYNAWEETPPQGWQEIQDKLLEERASSVTTSLMSSDYSVENCKNFGDKPLSSFNVDGGLNCTNNNTSFGFKINAVKVEGGSFSLNRNEWSNLSDANVHFGHFSNSGGGGDCGTGETCSEEHSVPFGRYAANVDASGDDSFIVFEKSTSDDQGVPNGSETQDCETVTSLESVPLASTKEKLSSDVSNVSRVPPLCCQKLCRTYLYIQMQLCRKENLKDWLTLNSEPRSKIQVLDFFDQIVSAVEYVHNEGLMHRDLKPSNIFFSVDGTIKVGDFGLVTTMAEGTEDHTPCEVTPSKKHTNQVGTQLYMSPEQIMGLAYNHKVDIFSLGLIFFELLVPFKTQMERQQVMSDVKQHTFPNEFLQDHSEESSFVMKLLSHNPEDRPSATDIKLDPLLQAFQPRPEILKHRRSRTLSRTYSTSSSGSLE